MFTLAISQAAEKTNDTANDGDSYKRAVTLQPTVAEKTESDKDEDNANGCHGRSLASPLSYPISSASG